jgi:hypothetical protein
MPSYPRGKIKIQRINPRRDGTFADVHHAADDAWWEAVFNDPRADAPRPHYGREYLGSMAGMLFGVRCEKCRVTKNFLADDLIKMYGAGINAQTVAAELSDCNRRSQGCLIRYVALPRSRARG